MITDERAISLRMAFNDIAIRELDLEVDENSNRIYEVGDGTINLLQYNDRFLKYYEGPNTIVRQNEMELNLLDNNRLMQILFGRFIVKYSAIHNLEVLSYYLTNNNTMANNPGQFVCTVEVAKKCTNIESDYFVNESVRILNLICKLNGTDNRYNFKELDMISYV